MTIGLSWEEETRALLNKAKEEARQATEKEARQLNRFADLLLEVLRLESQRRSIKINEQHSIDPETLRLKSIREVLIEIAIRSNGMLVARDVVKLLVQLGIYSDLPQARGSVYSELSRSKKDFHKERKGMYRLLSAAPGGLVLALH